MALGATSTFTESGPDHTEVSDTREIYGVWEVRESVRFHSRRYLMRVEYVRRNMITGESPCPIDKCFVPSGTRRQIRRADLLCTNLSGRNIVWVFT